MSFDNVALWLCFSLSIALAFHSWKACDQWSRIDRLEKKMAFLEAHLFPDSLPKKYGWVCSGGDAQ